MKWGVGRKREFRMREFQELKMASIPKLTVRFRLDKVRFGQKFEIQIFEQRNTGIRNCRFLSNRGMRGATSLSARYPNVTVPNPNVFESKSRIVKSLILKQDHLTTLNPKRPIIYSLIQCFFSKKFTEAPCQSKKLLVMVSQNYWPWRN